jgi:hypothetical protein
MVVVVTLRVKHVQQIVLAMLAVYHHHHVYANLVINTPIVVAPRHVIHVDMEHIRIQHRMKMLVLHVPT